MKSRNEFRDYGNINLSGILEPKSIFLNNGTEFASGIVENDKKIINSGVYYPKDEWKEINTHEFDFLFGNYKSHSNSIAIFKIPKAYLFGIESYDIKSSYSKMDDILKSELNIPITNIVEYLKNNYVKINGEYSVAINLNKGGQKSTTFDGDEYVYRGLHVDNWCRPHLSCMQRDLASVRISLNIGKSVRSFVFLNLSILKILKLFRKKLNKDHYSKLCNRKSCIHLLELFFHHYPNYPVVKIDLKPGEGYIAPVCNIIHDGYPVHQIEQDVNLQIKSNFMSINKKFVESINHP